MNGRTQRGALLLVFLALGVDPLLAASYTATLLHPAGFDTTYADGASDQIQAGSGKGTSTGGEFHALLWTGTADSVVDLQPIGYGRSFALAAFGDNQVGVAEYGGEHAILWHGTAASAIDLNPAGFHDSRAVGVWGGTQVGSGRLFIAPLLEEHALLWHGTADSIVDLHPVGFYESEASDVWGDTQVGVSRLTVSGPFHAMLWHGTAESKVDLHPAGFTSSFAFGVYGEQQVGVVAGPATVNQFHAMLWAGTTASAVDLNPVGAVTSRAIGVAGGIQVGDATFFDDTLGLATHAYAWQGTAASALDLHPFLSDLGPAFVWSTASDVAENGTIVGYAKTIDGTSYAVLWTPIPEPSLFAMLVCVVCRAALVRTRML